MSEKFNDKDKEDLIKRGFNENDISYLESFDIEKNFLYNKICDKLTNSKLTADKLIMELKNAVQIELDKNKNQSVSSEEVTETATPASSQEVTGEVKENDTPEPAQESSQEVLETATPVQEPSQEVLENQSAGSKSQKNKNKNNNKKTRKSKQHKKGRKSIKRKKGKKRKKTKHQK